MRTYRELEALEADTEEYLRCGRCNAEVSSQACPCGGPLIECVRVVDGPNTRLVRMINAAMVAYLDAGGSDNVLPLVARRAA